MAIDISLQTWTFLNEIRTSAEETLCDISRLGFETIELAGTGGNPAPQFARLCRDNGLEIVGIHQPCMIGCDLDEFIDEAKFFCECFQTDHITVMLDSQEVDITEDAYCKYADLIDVFLERSATENIRLSYHCYHYDHQTIGDTGLTGADLLLRQVKSQRFSLELDTFFISLAGLNVSEIIDKYSRRINFIHVNDISEKDEHAIVGTGRTRWSEVADSMLRSSVQYVVIEHTCDSPKRWAKESLCFLQDLFDGHLA